MTIENKINMIRAYTRRAAYEISSTFPDDIREEVETNIIMQVCDQQDLHISFKIIYLKLKQRYYQYYHCWVDRLEDYTHIAVYPSLYDEDTIDGIMEQLIDDFWLDWIERLLSYYNQKNRHTGDAKLYTERYSVYQKIKRIKKAYNII